MQNTAPPVLLIWEDLAIYRGESFATTRHSHFYGQLVFGLSEKKMRMAGRDSVWRAYDVAWIPSGLSHQTEATSHDFCFVLMDPITSGFSPDSDKNIEVGAGAFEMGNLLTAGARAEILHHVENADAAARGHILEILLRCVSDKKRKTDGRILKSIQAMLGGQNKATLAELARERGISPSRFRHLFREETGMPFSGYRLWLKTRAAIRELSLRGGDFSRAAFTAGFADQAHFSRIFRRSFGMAPSGLLKAGNKVQIFS